MNARSLAWEQLRADDFVLPPLPTPLFQRDNTCWIYGGATVNPMAKTARQRESLHTRAVYRFHRVFKDESLTSFSTRTSLITTPPSRVATSTFSVTKP